MCSVLKLRCLFFWMENKFAKQLKTNLANPVCSDGSAASVLLSMSTSCPPPPATPWAPTSVLTRRLCSNALWTCRYPAHILTDIPVKTACLLYVLWCSHVQMTCFLYYQHCYFGWSTFFNLMWFKVAKFWIHEVKCCLCIAGRDSNGCDDGVWRLLHQWRSGRDTHRRVWCVRQSGQGRHS